VVEEEEEEVVAVDLSSSAILIVVVPSNIMTKEAVTTSRGLAIVLNLRRRPDRRAWMQESCLKCLQDQLGVPVQILDAVDGRCLSVNPEEGTVHCPHSGDDHNDDIGGGRFHIFPGWKLGFEGICSMHTDWMMRLRYEPITAEEIERFYGRDLLAVRLQQCLSPMKVIVLPLLFDSDNYGDDGDDDDNDDISL